MKGRKMNRAEKRIIARERAVAIREPANPPAPYPKEVMDAIKSGWVAAVKDHRVGEVAYGMGNPWDGQDYQVSSRQQNFFDGCNLIDTMESACVRCRRRLIALPLEVRVQTEPLCGRCPLRQKHQQVVKAVWENKPVREIGFQGLLALPQA